MSAKKLGRFAAGLFVALGLAFGGLVAASASGNNAADVAADTVSIGTITAQREFDWS